MEVVLRESKTFTLPDKYKNLKDRSPNVLFTQHNLYDIKNTYRSIMNAIRRTVLGEIKTKVLHFEFDDFVTNDSKIKVDFIQNRIGLIPIDQSIPNNAEFKINETNNNQYARIIESCHIVPTDKFKTNKKYFNETFTICSLHAINGLDDFNFIKINKIKIIEGYGYENAKFQMACVSSIFPTDKKIMENNQSMSTVCSNYSYSLKTRSNITAHELFKLSLETVMDKLERVLTLTDDLPKSQYFKLIITGENYSICEIITEFVIKNFPDIERFKAFSQFNKREIVVEFPKLSFTEGGNILKQSIKDAISHVKLMYKKVNLIKVSK